MVCYPNLAAPAFDILCLAAFESCVKIFLSLDQLVSLDFNFYWHGQDSVNGSIMCKIRPATLDSCEPTQCRVWSFSHLVSTSTSAMSILNQTLGIKKKCCFSVIK